jgi:hypothetical protein
VGDAFAGASGDFRVIVKAVDIAYGGNQGAAVAAEDSRHAPSCPLNIGFMQHIALWTFGHSWHFAAFQVFFLGLAGQPLFKPFLFALPNRVLDINRHFTSLSDLIYACCVDLLAFFAANRMDKTSL